MDETTARFIERAKARRIELGLTQGRVAQLAYGWDKAATLICRIETGKVQRMSLYQAVKIARALETTVDALVNINTSTVLLCAGCEEEVVETAQRKRSGAAYWIHRKSQKRECYPDRTDITFTARPTITIGSN